jgi:hypothetical protein
MRGSAYFALGPLARVAMTADVYTHVLSDGREVDYEEVLT